MILSGGVLVKSPEIIWQGDTRTFPGFRDLELGDRWSSYAEIYQRQLWVSTVVNKLAFGEARLPLKVYEHDELNRPQVPDHPYARLLARPNEKHDRFFLWMWFISTYDVYGESFLGKVRDPGGRPVQLVPLHPAAMHIENEVDGELVWTFQNGRVRIEGIRSSDLIHPKTYNPTTTQRGLSRLEPLRRTLEFEDAAQRAQSSFWRNGARPGVLLKHKGQLSQTAQDRLKLQWNEVTAGANKTGVTVVLEEGLEPEFLTVSAHDSEYIESRKLNREEVCAVYDVPPPAVHILDRATFSNITEQLRSLYRDTHAPRLQLFESVLEAELRGSVRPGASGPDFGDDVYAEFLLDEVLRGDFETRADAYQKSDWLTVAEKRQLENRPYIDGTDRLFVNAATVPLAAAAFNAVGSLVRAGYEPEAVLQALNLPAIAHTGLVPVTVQGDQPAPAPVRAALRTLMGRLARTKTIDEVDAQTLTAGLDAAAPIVNAALHMSLASGHTIAQFRDQLRGIAHAEP